MPTLSKNVSEYFLSRLSAFWSVRRIAIEMNVSNPTVLRWTEDKTLPSVKYLKQFDKALKRLVEEIEDKSQEMGDFYSELALFILEEKRPPTIGGEQRQYSEQKSLLPLRQMIEDMTDGKKVRSTEVIAKGLEMGYTRAQIQRQATDLGVDKHVKGIGRNMKSYWSLK